MKRGFEGTYPDHRRNHSESSNNDRVSIAPASAIDAIRAAAKAATLQAQMIASAGASINTLTIRCPQSAVGKVIGKRGESIAQLQAQTKCNVQIDQSTKDSGFSTLNLNAKTREALMKCKSHLDALIASTQPLDDEAHSVPSSSAQASEQIVIDIPEASVGILIGPKGIVIHQMMIEFEIHMWIDQSMPPNGLPRKLAVLGPKANCEKALARVNAILTGKQNPALAAIENSTSTNYFKYQTEILQAFQDTANAEAIPEQYVFRMEKSWGTKLEGKRGNLLNQIRAQSSAKIELVAEGGEFVRVEVSGPEFATTRALSLIRERIPEEKLTVVSAPESAQKSTWFDQSTWNASTKKITAEEVSSLSEEWKIFSENF